MDVTRQAMVVELLHAQRGQQAILVRQAALSAAFRLNGCIEMVDGRPDVITVTVDDEQIAAWVLYGLRSVFEHRWRPIIEHHGSSGLTVRVNRGAAQLAVQAGLLDRAGRPVRGFPTNLVTGSMRVLIGVWQGALLTAGRFTPGARRSALRLSCPTPETVLALAGMARRLGVDTDISTSGSHGNEITIPAIAHIAAMLTLVGAPVTAGRTTRISASRPRTATPVSTRQNFNAANRDRSLSAAAVMTHRITQALDVLGARVPLHLAEAGRLRMSHPDLSLLELGKLAQPPVSKDTIAGRIRRLTTFSDQTPN